MTDIIYNGKNIAQDVEISLLEVGDSCGDQLDKITAVFANSENQWSGWNPKKGDTLEVAEEGYRSGVMWIDQIKQEGGRLALGAVSLPPNGRTKQTKVWENITLLTLAAEKAKNYGMSVRFFGCSAYPYARVDQLGRADFGFLHERALLEGCTIKIQNNELIVYDDIFMEHQPAVVQITPAQFYDEPMFEDSAGETYQSCSVTWGDIAGVFTDTQCIGGHMSVSDISVSSIAEAQRFAKNILRNKNKRESVGRVSVALNLNVTGGNVVEIAGLGISDGKYFVELAEHCFSDRVSTYKLRRCLERY